MNINKHENTCVPHMIILFCKTLTLDRLFRTELHALYYLKDEYARSMWWVFFEVGEINPYSRKVYKVH